MDNRTRGALVAVVCCWLFVPQLATAHTITLTFDDGDYDPTIVQESSDTHGPHDWVESNGIRAAGFWAVDVGTPGAFFQQGHTHIQPNWSGRADGRANKHHAWTNDLQGLVISLESGLAFDVVSIDYRLVAADTDEPDFQRLDWAWGADDPQMLLATSFDPTLPDFSSQWTPFSATDFGARYPGWHTNEISGFDGVTSFMVTGTPAYLYLDTIVLEVHAFVPEPSTLAMMALGVAGLGFAGRRPGRRLPRS